jgi:sulfite reductase (NADPH) hemoprotein beta-component
MSTNNRSEVELIKEKSNYLRGTIQEGLNNEITGAFSADDVNLIKFHGFYQQYDRETESERKHQKLEPEYSFMIRVRLVGGVANAEQWLAIDELADTYGIGNIKLTTRQAFQLHGILKRNLKPSMQKINKALMDTIAACGDVNRNVMCNPNPYLSKIHAQVLEDARKVSDHLTPRTGAYHEIWLDKDLIAGGEQEEEPIYGKLYLPRKFKIAFAIPPYNDVDVFANCLGFIAVEEKGKLVGYNISVGGGMGMTFGKTDTFPRLANVIGFCKVENVVDVAEKIVMIQRDLGNRGDRKQSRFKYTIENLGVEEFKSLLTKYLGYSIEVAHAYTFIQNGDSFGWQNGADGKWHLTLFIEGGRVKDTEDYKLKTALREVAKIHTGEFRLTGNQNLIISSVDASNKKNIEAVLKKHGVDPLKKLTALRLNSIACVALNTCSLAFSEAERYLPSLIDKLDVIIKKVGLEKDAIVIRMTGCPNGCGRPYLGEIGFVGKAPGRYNLYLGAGFVGDRLNTLYKENIDETEIIHSLQPILEDYAKTRNKDERFGDFVIRKSYVKALLIAKEFQL